MLALNTPDLPDCSGLSIGAVCVPWLLVGLLLGALALVLVRSLRALGQQARVLGGQDQAPVAFAGLPPRVSLIRLVPPPVETSRRRPRQR